MPALAADAQMLKHTAIVINGEMQAERSVGHIFEENNIFFVCQQSFKFCFLFRIGGVILHIRGVHTVEAD